MFLKKLKIKYKILLMQVLQIIIVSLILIAVLPQIKQTILKSSEQEMINETRLTSLMTKSIFDTAIRNYLRGISNTHLNTIKFYYKQFKDGKISEKDAKKTCEKILLSHKIGTSGYMTAVDISKGKDNITLAVHPKAKGLNISKFKFVQDLYKKKNGYMEFYWKNKGEKESRLKVMYMSYFEPWQWIVNAAPYKSELHSLINLKEFQNNLNIQEMQKVDQHTLIFDLQGNIIYHPSLIGQNIIDIKDVKTNKKFIKGIVNSIKKDNKYQNHIDYSYYKEDSKTKIENKTLRYIYLPEQQWVVCNIKSNDLILKPYYYLRDRLLMALIIMIIVIFLISMVSSKYLINRFKNLTLLANALSKNNYHFSITTNINDEIGELETIFNNATKKINSLTKEQEELASSLEVKILKRTKDLEETKQKIEAIHKHTRDAIEYASLIQGAVVSNSSEMQPFFKDYFVTWTPKDTVGGDIWLFNKLRHEDECLLFFIDCTGHGVPGAFVTMIVKAVEREIVSIIKADKDMNISPAWIMGYFNNAIKQLLKQETKDSISNAGWDGGIIYYNRRTQILKFAGAETPLFYMTTDREFKIVKGNRYSVGYKKCAMDYEYKETIIPVTEGMKFYCTTDGYLDQNGGTKDFPFGKKRFGNIIKEYHNEPMAEIQNIFMMEMMDWEAAIPNNDRNDDMTVIAFEIGKQSEFKEDIIEEIVKYEGVMTQNVIAAAMDNIESKITNMGMMGTVSTITIEYCQNMMNYSKNEDIGSRQIVPAGTIEVQYINDKYYDIIATNVVSVEDKEKIEPKLIEIQALDKAGIKKRYRELRKSGQNTHEKGGGIGIYEIAKVSDSIEYTFTPINEDKYSFTVKSFVKPKVREKI